MQKQNLPHVFLLITKADVGGAQIHVLSLIKSLKDQIRFTLGCGERDFLTDQANRLGVEVIVIPRLQRHISLVNDLLCVKSIRDILTRVKPDLLHVHSSKAGAIGRLAAKSLGVKSLFTAHGWAFTEGAGFTQRCYGLVIEWLAAKIGDGIVTVSKYDHDLADRYGVHGKTPNWLIRNCVAQIDGLTTSKPSRKVQLLNIGRMARAKNQKLLIDAVATVHREFDLSIIGSGHLRIELESRVTRLGLSDKVTFAENPDQISAWFSKSDIFVLSSDYEGLPLSVLEAMSARLPVIATDVGGVKEAVIDGSTGFLVDRGDAAALGSKITALIDDAELRTRFAENGLKRYQENFELENMTSQTMAVYKSLIHSVN